MQKNFFFCISNNLSARLCASLAKNYQFPWEWRCLILNYKTWHTTRQSALDLHEALSWE
jgi:hypothetical protein